MDCKLLKHFKNPIVILKKKQNLHSVHENYSLLNKYRIYIPFIQNQAFKLLSVIKVWLIIVEVAFYN